MATIVSNREARVVAAVVAEAEIDVEVAETANGAVETVLKLRERIAIVVATTEVPVRIKTASSSREKKLTAEEAEAAAATTASVVAIATNKLSKSTFLSVTEVKEVASAAATVVAATEGAAIVPKRRARLNQLSNNNKLSEHHRLVNSLRSDEMKVTMGHAL